MSEHATTEAVTEVPTVTVERWQMYGGCPGNWRPIGRFAWVWVYQCTGPDGTRFDNRSIVELRSVLRRKYGKSLVIVEPWKQAR